MSELKWYFPKTEEELKSIITQEEGVVPHSGGTGLLRGDVRKYKGLVDLGKLGISYIEEKDDFVEIGAMTTYGDILRYFKKENQNAILYKSLLYAASTPLRNRITIGGSIAYFPPWTDLMGTLFALSAQVYLTGKKEGWYSILDYARNRELHKKTVILKIRYKKDKDTGYSVHYRATRTRVDHPAFTITLLMEIKDKIVQSASFYAVGTKDKFTRLGVLEGEIVGRNVKDIKPESVRVDEVEFYSKVQFSPEYQKTLFDTEIRRKLKSILESVR